MTTASPETRAARLENALLYLVDAIEQKIARTGRIPEQWLRVDAALEHAHKVLGKPRDVCDAYLAGIVEASGAVQAPDLLTALKLIQQELARRTESACAEIRELADADEATEDDLR